MRLRITLVNDQLDAQIFSTFITILYMYTKKGKAIPLQAWTSPEGSKRLKFPDFKTIGT
jgi:hypothetical protein